MPEKPKPQQPVAQQQQQVEEGPGMLEQALSILKMFLFMYAASAGLVPRSEAAKRSLQAFRQQIKARGDIVPLEQKEIDKVVDTVARWFGFPSIEQVPEKNRQLIYEVARYVNWFAPEIMDYVLAPTGSFSQLYSYLGAGFQKFDPTLSRVGPNGKPLFQEVGEWIIDKFYANANLRDNRFIALTGGMPAGAFGEMVYHLLTLGLVPFNEFYDEIISAINRHAPAVVRTGLLLQSLGKSNIDISDVVTAYNALLASLVPEKIGGTPAEQIERLRHTIARLKAVFAPKGPGELSTEEALKKDAERIVKAINSMGGRWYGTLVYALQNGFVSPASIAGRMASQILSGRPVPVFNSNQVYSALVRSGVRPADAVVMLQSPNIYKPYFNDPRLQHALRGAQWMEFNRNMNMLAFALRRGGVSPGLAHEAAMANFAALVGYTLPEARQILGRYDPTLFDKIQQLTEENLRRPESLILGRNDLAVRAISTIKDIAQNPPKDWFHALLRVIGGLYDYVPEELETPPAGIPPPGAPAGSRLGQLAGGPAGQLFGQFGRHEYGTPAGPGVPIVNAVAGTFTEWPPKPPSGAGLRPLGQPIA